MKHKKQCLCYHREDNEGKQKGMENQSLAYHKNCGNWWGFLRHAS